MPVTPELDAAHDEAGEQGHEGDDEEHLRDVEAEAPEEEDKEQ